LVTILRIGSRAPEVQHLQELLNKLLKPSPHLSTDANFGPRTEAAVRLYQAAVGLGIDGIADPYTLAALQKGQVISQTNAVSIPTAAPDAPWMAVAMKEIGQREIRGTVHNPRIISYHATTTLWAHTDETP
jgi:peptidoglycan hydrolase-like protein with peptidoglycan-binding domain